MARMKSLKDISGETIYPKTVASAVMFDDQNTMGALASNGLYVSGETQDFEELDPINADTLQGHDSNYFASKEDLTNVKDEITASIKAEITPEPGVDYFTENDKSIIVSRVYDMIKNGGVVGFIDANNNIILNGNIPKNNNYSIKYEMDDESVIVIGKLEFVSDTIYSIINNLTHCTNGNSITNIIEGESYSATISANSGYELKSVSVTMGGNPVDVVDGVINIANVTGSIVITAVAEESVVAPSYTNLLPSAIDTDGTLYNSGLGYIEGYRLSGSSETGVSALTDCCASGYIPIISIQDVIRIKNITVCSEATANRLIFYNSSKTKLYEVGSFHSNPGVTVSDGVYEARPQYWDLGETPAYFRFSAGVISEDTIVTVNEEIV